MDEPLFSKTTKPEFQPKFPNINNSYHLSTTSNIINSDDVIPIIAKPNNSSLANLLANLNKNRRRRLTRRSHSAPSVISDVREAFESSLDPRPARKSTPLIIKQAFIGIVIYTLIGISVYLIKYGSFKGNETLKPVDALYYAVVALCTIGYGDIVPDTTFTKLFTCGFILVGFGFIDILLSGLVTYVLDRQEPVILSAVDESRLNTMVRTYMIDTEKGQMRIRIKVGLALAVVIGCITVGTVAVHILEGMSWVDSFYLSVTSVTTVGYGDYAFRTLPGRCFAIIWLLVKHISSCKGILVLSSGWTRGIKKLRNGSYRRK